MAPFKFSFINVVITSSSNLKSGNVKDYDKYSSDQKLVLENLKIKSNNSLVIGSLNINSISKKFDNLKLIIQAKVDVLVITETKTFNFSLNRFYNSELLKTLLA